MKNIIKTASIVTSGIIVGALVRKYSQQGLSFSKLSALDSIQSVKSIFSKKGTTEDLDNYFV